MGLLWPDLIRIEEAETLYGLAQDTVIGYPQGRGALPVTGRLYLIPAEFTAGQIGSWDEERQEYSLIRGSVPYARWIDGFALPTREPWADPRNREHAGFQIVSRSGFGLTETTVLCAPDRVFGLRQCVGERPDQAQLEALDIDVDALEPVSVGLQRTQRFMTARTLALDDRRDVAAELPDTLGVINKDMLLLHCGGPQTDGGDVAPSQPEDRWLGECALVLAMDDGAISLEISSEVLEFWPQVLAGFIRDLAAWNAAAEDAERIDVVADRVAADWARQQQIGVSPLCQFDRILVAAIGIEWTVSRGFNSSLFGPVNVGPACGPTIPDFGRSWSPARLGL